MALRFSWNARKAAGNLRKHGRSFSEAASAFRDPLSFTVADPDHSEAEERSYSLGYRTSNGLVIVAHTERGDEIRLITARLASRRERATHEEGI